MKKGTRMENPMSPNRCFTLIIVLFLVVKFFFVSVS